MNRFNILYSVCHYIPLKLRRKIKIQDYSNSKLNTKHVFLTLNLSNHTESFKTVKFEVTFKNCRISNKAFIRLSKLTIPFFAGLPGFLNKQFIVNESSNEFTGIYEWSSMESVENYITSYAMKAMKWWSKPFKLNFNIIRKRK